MGLALLGGSPVAGATLLQNAGGSPASGTTDTTFVLSVDYVSEPEARPALSASVEVVGLGGSPLPMALVAGTATDGTWQTSTMLPAGNWDLIFRADASGSDPDPVVGLVLTVIDAATPTPSPSPGGATPAPTIRPTATPTATVTPSPPATTAATPVPTPLPPGVTPTPSPRPASSAAPPSDRPASGSAASSTSPSDGPSARSSARAMPSSTGAPTRSPAGSAAPGEGLSAGSGWGQAGWIVLGGLTSAAGAAVLARQWLVRRTATGP